MDAMEPTPVETDVPDIVIDDLIRTGVTGNGGVDVALHDVEARWSGLYSRLAEAGYSGGRLAFETLMQGDGVSDAIIYDTARFTGHVDAEAAWARHNVKRWHDLVEQRVEDWLGRLEILKSLIELWIRVPEFSALNLVDRPPVTMSKELMRRFNVPPRPMIPFDIADGSRCVLRFRPKGLWIIGANGRVDITTKFASAVLIDQSAPLSGASDWRIYDVAAPARPSPFTQAAFDALLRGELP